MKKARSQRKTSKPAARMATLYFRGVDKDVKDCFKAWCARRGVSMTSEIIKLMRWRITGKAKEADNTAA